MDADSTGQPSLRWNRAGDVEALYDEHSRALFTYALSLTGDRAASEDLVHDAFIRLIEYPREVPSIRAFLFAVVRNLATDLRRRQAVRRENVPPLPLSSESPDEGFAESVSRALGLIPEEQREAVVLKIYAGLTFAAIGEITGSSTATVASRYRLGLEKIADLLGKEKSS